MMAGSTELTTDEWCNEQLYQLLVQKCEGPALAIVRNQNTQGKARGLIAWYRTLRDAEGQVETKRSEIIEKVFNSGRKAVAAKNVVATIETWEKGTPRVQEPYRAHRGQVPEAPQPEDDAPRRHPKNARDRRASGLH